MIQTIAILGAGSAGLLSALSLSRLAPFLRLRVVRSPEMGVIGVGEGTTPYFPRHLFQHLGIGQRWFYENARPTWKLGLRFIWGPRPDFTYPFAPFLNAQWNDLTRPTGDYCFDDFRGHNLGSALMEQGKAFARGAHGEPLMDDGHAFHIENERLCQTLEKAVREAGVEIIDGRVESTIHGPTGLTALRLDDGRQIEADFFIDASGFRSELLGRALEEPFLAYDRSLFCDRALVGGWERHTEPILPYTVVETMDAGWAWQIDHEHHLNRGYVFSSSFISDDEAAAEFLRKNPRLQATPRLVKFRSGRRRRFWVDNVVAMGNAGAFVEPLEATALMMVCIQSQALGTYLKHFGGEATPSLRRLYNERMAELWDDIRDFLALHYRFNTRLATPFWGHCQHETDVSPLQPLLDFYAENGPSAFARELLPARESTFGIEGYLALLMGQAVPFRHPAISEAERVVWEKHREDFTTRARHGLDVREALHGVRHPQWRWNDEIATANATPA